MLSSVNDWSSGCSRKRIPSSANLNSSVTNHTNRSDTCLQLIVLLAAASSLVIPVYMLNAGTPCDHREYAARRSTAESEADHQLKESLDRKHKSLAAELRNFKAAKLKQLERYHY